MHNFWLVAKHAYRQMVVRRGFILTTVAIPVGIALLIAIAILIETSGENNLPIGYVDQAGFLDESLQGQLPEPEDRVEIWGYASVADARAALGGGEIQAFFVFPANYRQTLKTELYFLDEPPRGEVWREFDNFVRINLVDGLAGEVKERVLEGPSVTVHDITNDREFSDNAVINILVPILASIFFFFATMSAGGYLLGVVASEKENRTMELMLTSVTPAQLIVGKAVGLLSAALTQLAIYVITAVIGLSVAAAYVEQFQQLTVPWGYLGLIALFFFPAYGLVASAMVAIGGAVTELQQAQQVAGIINLFFMFPFFLLGVVITNPAHPLMTAMTLFPTTSFLTISMRWGLGTIPLWQLVVSWLLLVSSMILMMWAAARIFRAGMLRYGQPLTFKAAVASVRGRGG